MGFSLTITIKNQTINQHFKVTLNTFIFNYRAANILAKLDLSPTVFLNLQMILI